MKKVNRKDFLLVLPAMLTIAVVWLWKRAITRHENIHTQSHKIYFKAENGSIEKVEGILFFMHQQKPIALSGKCTHLGCSLHVFPDGRIVCPCHGSEYTAEGKVIQGPAKKDLENFPVFYDTYKKQYYIKIQQYE